MSKSPGVFVWYELLTTDHAAAERFYRQVIGWEARDSELPGMSYTIFSAGPTAIAGLMELPEAARHRGVRPAWMGYVGVEDVDAAAAEFGKAGGLVYKKPTDIRGVGRFAVAADPQGAVLTLFKGASDAQPAPVPRGTHGHISWRELHATDYEAAFSFYADRFGWVRGRAVDMGPLGVYQQFGAVGTNIGGMMTARAEISQPSWLYYFNVGPINAAASRVKAAGGEILNGPSEKPGGDFSLLVRDPQGAVFALVELRSLNREDGRPSKIV